MKILIQNSVFFPQVIGGAEISSHLLGMVLRARGLSVDAVASTGICGSGRDLTTRPTADGLGTVYEAPAHGLCDFMPTDDVASQPGLVKRGLHHFASVHSPRWRRLFDEVLSRTRPDIVHTNTIVGLTPAIWSAAGARGIPVVHTIRDYHLLCPRTTLLRSSGEDCLEPPLPCRVLAGLKMARTRGLQAVTGPTRYVLAKHLDAGGFAGARDEVIPNALEEWPPDIPQRPDDGPVRGLFLGQIDGHKGIPVLLEALTALFDDPDCRRLSFDFAGTGPLVPAVKAFCAVNPDRARYHGMVKGDEKRNLLGQASFMVVPSVWAEPFSRSIIDGFSWGLPAIGARRGGIPEVITDGVDGQLIEPTATNLATAMRRCTLDSAFRRQQGTAARASAATFTLERQADRFIALYHDLLGATEAQR